MGDGDQEEYDVIMSGIDQSEYSSTQGWNFTGKGQIKNLHTGDHVLTRLSSGSLIMAPFGNYDKSLQTWGIKEKTSSHNQWEKTKTYFYRRKAFCWPVHANDAPNFEYKWPLEGEFVTDLHFVRDPNDPTELDEKRVRIILDLGLHINWN